MRWGMDEPPLKVQAIGALGYLRIVVRGLLVGGVTYGGLVLLLVLRVIEAPLFGQRRPLTPWITQAVCKFATLGMGLAVKTHGTPMRARGAIVANHLSWLDIFVLNGRQNVYFVAKSEVAGWPGIGWLARATGTVFIARKSTEAAAQREVFVERLKAGHHLVFFPEGTSTDGQRVLPFKSTLFAAFFAPELHDIVHIQPVSLVYHAPAHAEPRYYGWWADMGFAEHLLRVLALAPQGRVEVVFHAPHAVADFADRKALARVCEEDVRRGLEQRLTKP